MDENRKLKVFLCHSKDDKSKVRELYRRLTADGFDAWLDEEKLMPGQEWDLEIHKAVRESDVVLVCLSNNSITKAGYVQKEIRFALDIADEQPEGAIFIIPARLEDCEVPSRLNKWQWVNLFDEKGYKQLTASLRMRAETLEVLWYIPIDFEPQVIKISAGIFLMGSTIYQAEQVIKEGGRSWKEYVKWEQPQHEVELSDYFIGKYPVTNREYEAFVRDTKHRPPQGWNGDQYYTKKGNHPVVNVSWNDANEYCRWLSDRTHQTYRLPTEAEWEKAARGEDGRTYAWGNVFDPKRANTNETRIGDTSEIGMFSPQGDSPFGCADIIGNVWEWCNDWFDKDEYKYRIGKVVKDPQGPKRGHSHILRGGSYLNLQRYARCAGRFRNAPEDILDNNFGFRVVREASSLSP